MGDVAMLVPVVHSLARQYPDLHISVLSRGFARALFSNLAPNVSFMEVDFKGEDNGKLGLSRLYRRLKAKHFTAVADMHGVLRSHYLRWRFTLDRVPVAHIDKHRNGRKRLVASSYSSPLPSTIMPRCSHVWDIPYVWSSHPYSRPREATSRCCRLWWERKLKARRG